MTEVITLIRLDTAPDEYGDPVITETRRDVFAEQMSIGQKEFYQAHAVGLQPEVKFRLTDYLDYENEPCVDYAGQRYRVLRTFRTGQELEIVCYREANPDGGT